MDPDARSNLKRTFEIVVERLSKDLSERAGSAKYELLSSNNTPPQDSPSFSAESLVIAKINKRNSLLISELEEALKRMEEGCYGICQECRREIDEDKLRREPMTTLCHLCRGNAT